MDKYIDRLVKCGYERNKAVRTCEEFTRNLPLVDLELFVEATEEQYKKNHVEILQQ